MVSTVHNSRCAIAGDGEIGDSNMIGDSKIGDDNKAGDSSARNQHRELRQGGGRGIESRQG